MKTPDLKPCPFCGGEAELVYHHQSVTGYYDGKAVRVTCKNCRAKSPYGRNPRMHGSFKAGDETRAIAAWNKRCGMTEAMNKRIDQLNCGVIALCETIGQVKESLCDNKKATNEELLQAVSQVKSRLAQVERERDAAIKDLGTEKSCFTCAYGDIYSSSGCEGNCRLCANISCPCESCNYKWRGVCAENTKEE